MAENGSADAVSITILILLMFISSVLVGYISLFLYTRYKKSKDKNHPGIDFFQSSWLDAERKPLIPGNVHTRTIQPVLSNDGGETEEEEFSDAMDFKERDFSKLGRIIFVMRYNKRREELMVRLVQIEGLPVQQNLYNPHSAYVDVQLKYTGLPDSSTSEVQAPPRLDICLQQVYYFIISTQQMMSHSLEFQINTFDDRFRRHVSGMVEMNLCEELGDDILTGNEVVFVKDILEPFKFSDVQQHGDEDDFVSAVSDIDEQQQNINTENDKLDVEPTDDVVDKSRTSSHAASNESLASNMSWEPEVSTDLLSASMNSLYYRCSSEVDLISNLLTQDKRAHSVGYLPTYEWTITDIPLDDDITPTHERASEAEDKRENVQKDERNDYYKFYDDDFDEKTKVTDLNLEKNIDPPPESFYTIVPVTPLHPKKFEQFGITESSGTTQPHSFRKLAFKKHSIKLKQQLGRSLSINRKTGKKTKVKKLEKSSPLLDRSSSWPSLVPGDDSSLEASPIHKN